MTTTRIFIFGLMLCCLAVPGFAGGYEPVEQPPMEPVPVDQTGACGQSGTAGQSGGIGNGQMQGTPVESGTAQQGGTPVQGLPTTQGNPGHAEGTIQSGSSTQGQTGCTGCNGCNGCNGQTGTTTQYGQASAADFQALILMLNLVMGDLEMCQMSLQTNHHYVNDLMSIGYLNSAKSALARTRMHPAYMPLLAEIDQRLSKIKFHLVMNDEMTVRMMIAQLSAMMQSIIANQAGIQTGTQVQYYQPTSSQPGVTGSYPTVTVVPVYPVVPKIIVTGWSQGQNLNPTSVPVNLVPVSDNY